jgi:hypothetical protein
MKQCLEIFAALAFIVAVSYMGIYGCLLMGLLCYAIIFRQLSGFYSEVKKAHLRELIKNTPDGCLGIYKVKSRG